MNHTLVDVLELVGWGFDSYAYRPKMPGSETDWKALERIAQRAPVEETDAVLAVDSKELREGFESLVKRDDFLAEMSGLTWSLGVVDLRTLIAFQRRLALSADTGQPPIPVVDDWPALLKLSFGSPKSVTPEIFHDRATKTLTIRSNNPNLHIRLGTNPIHPLIVHGGAPFLEVGRLRDRWFLRDGYHRAYALLQTGVYAVPAVIVEARNMKELGANEPWFFPEEVLFSETPPMVVDFLNEDLTLKYQRPPFVKTIHIKTEETLKPETFTGEQS